MTQATPGNPVDLDAAAEAAVEGEIRDMVRRDVAGLRRAPDSEPAASNITTLLQRVAGTSVEEIDRLIAELQTLRGLLDAQGTRIQREIAEYAHLSQSAMRSTTIIGECLAQWNRNGS